MNLLGFGTPELKIPAKALTAPNSRGCLGLKYVAAAVVAEIMGGS